VKITSGKQDIQLIILAEANDATKTAKLAVDKCRERIQMHLNTMAIVGPNV